LFSGVAGTLIEAERRHAGLAVFVVHAFASPNFNAQAVADNDAGIRSFFAPLLPGVAGLEPGVLIGPFHVSGSAQIPQGPMLAGTVTTHIPAYAHHRRSMPSEATLERLRSSYEEALQSPILIEAVRTRTPIAARSLPADEQLPRGPDESRSG
jgi:hypothetical protein